MLERREPITGRVIKLICPWHHSRFNVYSSDWIYPRFAQSMEKLARYIIKASFSQERLSYVSESSKVVLNTIYRIYCCQLPL